MPHAQKGKPNACFAQGARGRSDVLSRNHRPHEDAETDTFYVPEQPL